MNHPSFHYRLSEYIKRIQKTLVLHALCTKGFWHQSSIFKLQKAVTQQDYTNHCKGPQEAFSHCTRVGVPCHFPMADNPCLTVQNIYSLLASFVKGGDKKAIVRSTQVMSHRKPEKLFGIYLIFHKD